jgi:hypothetical protein
MMTTLARAARRRLALGRISTERVTLEDGRWIDVFVRRADRRHTDHAQLLRETLAPFAARTNVTDANGRRIDPASPDAWRVLAYRDLLGLARAISKLVQEGLIEDDPEQEQT